MSCHDEMFRKNLVVLSRSYSQLNLKPKLHIKLSECTYFLNTYGTRNDSTTTNRVRQRLLGIG